MSQELETPARELERLRTDLAEQRALLDKLPIATAVKNREGRILYVNAAASAGYGLTCEAMLGKTEHDVLPPGNNPEEVLSLDREVIDSGRSLSVPGQCFWTAEGRQMVLHMTREPVRFHGEPCVLVNAHDVTDRSEAAAERRKLERKMAEAQRLEGLGLMAGGIAHDFNNLLVGVLANADLALRNLSEPTMARGFIERIKLAAERLAGSARQMLAYSGRGHVRVAPLELAQLTRESLELVASNVPAHVQLDCALPATLPEVEGDAAQLSQVIINLTINAVEAIGDRPGRVRVSVHREFLDNDRTASLALRSARGAMDCLCLEISDDGPGMDRATRNRVFDPFFTTKDTPGRGLGLASVMGIVRSHQGSIRVDTEPGAGTRMRVWLPLSSERRRTSTLPPGATRPEVCGRCVLVVDDEAMVRETTASVLKSHGFSVHVAVDGADAVAVAERLEGVDLILLDMTMPGMSAQQAYRALRAALPETGILLTSGYNDPSVLDQLLRQPNTAFIQKPYAVDELLRRCASLLD